MREIRNAQASIFDFYAEHEHGRQLKTLSDLLDKYAEFARWIEQDLNSNGSHRGARGLSAESVFRCLLLKQILQVSYERLAFHLSDSNTYRTFARLEAGQSPSRSGLQSTIRQVGPDTLEKINRFMLEKCFLSGEIKANKVRIDSTVVDSNIAPPSDSGLLNDGIRVLSRLLSKSQNVTDIKLRIVDQRKRSKSLLYRIFNAKKAEKQVLYPELLFCARTVVRQVDRALLLVRTSGKSDRKTLQWIERVSHYQELLCRVIEQTERRVISNEKVPSTEKIVSLFEEHSDIIVKGMRDVQYGHKINLATQEDGFIIYLSIESGNPSDKELYLPVLDSLETHHGILPRSTICDGGYASQANVVNGRAKGVRQAAFHKRLGLGCHAMGVKEKTLKRLRNFRAGIEGNISELKRAYGASKATWKGAEGFKAFVWASVLSYNLMRRVRFSSG